MPAPARTPSPRALRARSRGWSPSAGVSSICRSCGTPASGWNSSRACRSMSVSRRSAKTRGSSRSTRPPTRPPELLPMAKTKEPGVVYQLKITLRDIKPPVWRRVQVKDCTLSQLHSIIQTCMGWDGYHLHSFEIGGEQYSEPDPDGMMDVEDE